MNQRRRKQNQDGSALIMVLCILCIFMALILAMSLASFQVLNRSRSAATQEQCRISALTFNAAMEHEIESNKEGTTWLYLYNQIKNKEGSEWTYYNEDEAGHGKTEAFRTMTAQIPVGLKGKVDGIEFTSYWEYSAEDMESKHKEIVLVTVITVRHLNQKYSVITQYASPTEPWSIEEKDWKWIVSWQGGEEGGKS